MSVNETVKSLETSLKARNEEFKSLQGQAAEIIREMNEAQTANDAGRVGDVSSKMDRIGVDLKSKRQEIDNLTLQLRWFDDPGVDDALAGKTNTTAKSDLSTLIEAIKSNGTGSHAHKTNKTVGQHFADMLQAHNVKSWNDLTPGASLSLTAQFGKGLSSKDEQAALKEIKSIYANNGDVLTVAGQIVPGHTGYQCGLVELPLFGGLSLPPDDFEEFVTTVTMPPGNRVRYTRMTARRDNAGMVAETVYGLYPSMLRNGTKPEGDFTLATAEERVAKIAENVKVSDEVLEDCPSVAGLIDTFLVEGVNLKKRQQLISGTGLNGDMRGLLNQPNLLARVHRGSPNGVSGDNLYDTFRRAMTDLWYQGTNLGNVRVIMNPTDTEIIDLTKDTQGRYLFNDQDCMARQLRCLQWRVGSDVPAGTAVIGEFQNNWFFYVRQALMIAMGLTGNQFIENAKTIQAEIRGLTFVLSPQKIERITGIAL